MMLLSAAHIRLSMGALASAAMLAASAPAMAGGTPSPYYGRWTVNEDKPVFTARGRAYKTIDVAPCGRDFCGVSVDDKGKCGQVLFRFLDAHAKTESLRGHGRWGAEQKNVVIYSYGGDSGDASSTPGIEIYLGDGYDLGGRSGNMPKFHAEYRKLGAARCIAR